MVSSERLLLIVAADRRELSALDHHPLRLQSVRWAAQARVGGTPALLAANGPGRENAAEAVDWICERRPIAGIISAGYVGGLAPDLAVGDVVLPARVRAVDGDVEYPVTFPLGGSECGRKVGPLLTIDRVAQTPPEKAELHALGADIVDMEAAAVAQAAVARETPFFCVRAVSDDARARFTFDFNRARRSDGSFSGWNLAAQAGLSPQRWRRLFELKRDGDLASLNLARCLSQCRFLPS